MASETSTPKNPDLRDTIGEKANKATAAVGGGMKTLAGTLRDYTPSEGVLGSAASSLAQSLESGGRYLQDGGLSGMAKDITNLVRRYPIPAVSASDSCWPKLQQRA